MTDETLEVTETTEEQEVVVKTPVHYADSSNRVHSFDCQETADIVGTDGLTLIEGDVYEWVEANPLIITMTEDEILQARKAAYANTSTGSDVLFIEYQALVAKESDSAEAAKEAWLARREEIKLEYPKSS